MPNFIITWLITAIALLITAYIIPGIRVDGFVPAVIAAAVLGLVNAIVRPIFFILTLPLTILTLGLFLLVINALMLWLASVITPRFRVEGFVPALLGSVVLSLVSGLLSYLLR